MTWLLWRQYRATTYWTSALLAAFATATVLTGIHMAHVYEAAHQRCPTDAICVPGHLFSGYGAIIDTVHLTLLLPVILGVMIGATLVARETEHSTNVLVWTQGVTRRRWMYSKVATVIGGTFVVSTAVSALVTWWSNTPNSLDGNRFEGAQFETQNLIPVAAALFAVSLGLAMGALIRRTLPAIGATVGAYVVSRFVLALYVRPRLLSPLTATAPLTTGPEAPRGSWTVSQRIVDAAGHAVNGPIRVPAGCGALNPKLDTSCLDRAGYREAITYHPPSHYWPMQWMESGILVAAAAILVAVAIVVTLRRDA